MAAVLIAGFLMAVGFRPEENGLMGSTGARSVLLLSSYDDVYSLEFNNYWRTEASEDFVEGRYDEILDAASLGDDYFNQFLQSKGITHVLVPESTSVRGRVFHKWGERGSINIDLNSRFFTLDGVKNGPFPSVLYRVRKSGSNSDQNLASGYSIKWSNVDWWFYQSGRSKKEFGMYAYSDYYVGYDSGEIASWFYDLSPDRSNELILQFNSKSIQKVNIRIGLLAAYGINAPDHEVLVEAETFSERLMLTADGPIYTNVVVESGNEVRIKNVTPCKLPREFEPNAVSEFKICFGVGTVEVTPVAVNP